MNQSVKLASDLACYRLFQLTSPSLPIGGFTYSQGLEYAVEAGWVTDRDGLEQWLKYMVNGSVATLELPILDRLYHAIKQQDIETIEHWCDVLYTSRETSELRAEERQRGQAFYTLLTKLGIDIDLANGLSSQPNQLLGLCIAAHAWSIDLESLKQGYLWSWLENIVTAGVKLVPLGQTDGQLALIHITESFPKVLAQVLKIEEWMIGSFTPSIAIASSLHETQYTRLFRS
ncbi:urease accessory protein UreF [Vibrio sp. UCD-FRSSP16_10]|uniref:urease accessory protein UreF n=1 Tax=unclassified Vibrio TaxID=2614977 RepID=UPI0007FF9BB5|nr:MULTISPECIES: urease accessory UreF family protein [unclassified Vibrio]OBT10123.1 urease accessory protein UreF [Vibrio sp. UCD-FRSSP16_30]OBT18913.1 urease accessory protein UreF [Vibrio sp. UCD-FRSSP16_10]